MVAEARPAEPDGSRHNGTGAPCRHCLRDAEEGEELMLGSYQMPTSAGHLLDAKPVRCRTSAWSWRFIGMGADLPDLFQGGGEAQLNVAHEGLDSCQR
jgi:hypothetical protein